MHDALRARARARASPVSLCLVVLMSFEARCSRNISDHNVCAIGPEEIVCRYWCIIAFPKKMMKNSALRMSATTHKAPRQPQSRVIYLFMMIFVYGDRGDVTPVSARQCVAVSSVRLPIIHKWKTNGAKKNLHRLATDRSNIFKDRWNWESGWRLAEMDKKSFIARTLIARCKKKLCCGYTLCYGRHDQSISKMLSIERMMCNGNKYVRVTGMFCLMCTVLNKTHTTASETKSVAVWRRPTTLLETHTEMPLAIFLYQVASILPPWSPFGGIARVLMLQPTARKLRLYIQRDWLNGWSSHLFCACV